MTLSQYNKRALFSGLIAAIITGAAAYLLGNVSGYEAKILIESSLPGINMLCNTVVLASATILALLLTLLSISNSSDSNLNKKLYQQVATAAKLDVVLFVTAILCFQLFNIPITEADNVPKNWYSSIYWSILFSSSLLSGGLVSVIIMLYNTVINIIKIFGYGDKEHDWIDTHNKEG
jgi:hypothetical protein